MRRLFFLGLVSLAVMALVGVFHAAQSLGTSNDDSPSPQQTQADAAGPASQKHEAPSMLDWSLLGVTVAGAAVLLVRPRRRAVAAPSPR